MDNNYLWEGATKWFSKWFKGHECDDICISGRSLKGSVLGTCEAEGREMREKASAELKARKAKDQM